MDVNHDGHEYAYDKINQIRIYNGEKFTTENTVSAGQLFAVTGINNAVSGNYVFSNTIKECDIEHITDEINVEINANMKSKVIFDKSLNINEI